MKPTRLPQTLRARLDSPQKIIAHVKDLIPFQQEHIVALYLDAQKHLIARETISIGTVSASLLHPRELFAPAILHRASAVVLIHNHPSGSPEPSHDDLTTTRQMVLAAQTLDIPLLDHVIVAKHGWRSLRQLGHL